MDAQVELPTIRRYLRSDIPSILKLLERFHEESAYVRVSFDKDKTEHILANNLTNDMFLVTVLVQEDKVIGLVWAYVVPYLFSAEVYADCFGYYILPEHRRYQYAVKLYREFIEWAKRRGCKQATMATTTEINTDRFGKLMEHFGLDCVGTIWRKDL